jgi:3-hydroxyacyl-CoA dehydrogenase/enoyl-CoA hydratase/3-hydroxybutyryl-CoA epimerase
VEATQSRQYRHWRARRDADGVLWLAFDKEGTGTNVLASDVLLEADALLAEIEQQPPRALIVCSAKKNGFVAGADIKEFTRLATPDEAYTLIRRGQAVFDRIEALRFPTVALINGFALGGGLELALACRYRIVVDDSDATLGLPEVKLGIHPGFGGTVRSVRLVGVLNAMSMMLSGRNVRPREALRMGLVDQVVPARHLERAAHTLALEAAPRKPRKLRYTLLDATPVRGLVAQMLERQVAKQAPRQHYPAPYAIIDLWRRHASDPVPQQLDAEARSIAELMCTRTSRNLVRVFMLQDRLKGLAGKPARPLEHVHVVGAGTMGGDIAAWCSIQGLRVSLQDREPKYIAPAIGRARKLFEKRLREPRLVEAAMDRLIPDHQGHGVVRADVVIEAIFENLEAKQNLFRSIEPRLKRGALLATNTSSIRLETLREALSEPARLVGLHFFNPVARMPLVEVIRAQDADAEAVAFALAFAKRINKLPLPCSSAPGFVVNRVLMPYLMEAFRAGEESIPLVLIDRAATDFGMPMGPVELADTVGLDVCLSVAQVFSREFGVEVPARLREMVERKELGRKSGRGFYEWRKGKPLKPPAHGTASADLADRLILPMLNEAVACLREGVVADADLLDAGVIFGTGFAPFTGGPLHHARQRGVDNVLTALHALRERYGERFQPDVGWGALRDEPRPPFQLEHGAGAP